MSHSPLSTARRRTLQALGGGAALAGLGAWLWSSASQRQAARKVQMAADRLMQERFADPQGGVVDMAALRGAPLLVNFWATWCPPCVHELPLLDRFYAENKANGWQVLGIAADRAQAVQAFLRRTPLAFAVAVADGGKGLALAGELGNTKGGLPFSVALHASGKLLGSKLGQLNLTDLALWQQMAANAA